MDGNTIGGGIGDAGRLKPARFVSSPVSITPAPAPTPADDRFELDPVETKFGAKPGDTGDEDEADLDQAIEAKHRDNVVLGETLVDFGLLDRNQLSEVRSAQTRSDDVVESLTAASAIRTRLGDILHRSKQVTSAQLEVALEQQRLHGGLLGEILLGMGVLDRGTLDAALAVQARLGRGQVIRQ